MLADVVEGGLLSAGAHGGVAHRRALEDRRHLADQRAPGVGIDGIVGGIVVEGAVGGGVLDRDRDHVAVVDDGVSDRPRQDDERRRARDRAPSARARVASPQASTQATATPARRKNEVGRTSRLTPMTRPAPTRERRRSAHAAQDQQQHQRGQRDRQGLGVEQPEELPGQRERRRRRRRCRSRLGRRTGGGRAARPRATLSGASTSA